MAEQLQSIKVILDKIHRNPMLSEVSLETAIDYTVDFMRIVGVPNLFYDKVEVIPIVNYKASLPVDWIDTIQIKFNDVCLRYSNDSFITKAYVPEEVTVPEIDFESTLVTSIAQMTNPDLIYKMVVNGVDRYYEYHDGAVIQINFVTDTNTSTNNTISDYSFKIQGGIIHTTIKEGDIELAYRAIGIDEYGLPMIPDNSNFTRALELYIKLQHYGILFDLGKINQQVIQKAQQDYAWAVGALETDSLRLDLSKAESFFNSLNQLFIKNNEFKHGFKNEGAKQILINKRYGT